jgi:glycosyltransferase involved in cell wall biosynthesis
MRICFLSPLVPSVAYGHRPHSFLKYLRSRGHEVTLHCIDDPGPVLGAVEGLRAMGVDVRPFSLPRLARWGRCFVGYPGKVPLRVLHCRSPKLEKTFLEDLKSGGYEVAHVDRFRLAPFAAAAKRVFDGPVFLDYPDALSLYYRRAVENPRHFFKSIVDRREHRAMPGYERNVLKYSVHNIVCSEVDKDHLLAADREADIKVIPNMVDLQEFAPHDRPDGSARLTFTGTLYYLPNIDGLLWLKEKVLPLLPESLKVDVLGFGATSELDPVKADPRFRFHGYVENMAEHLYRDDIFLCPLRVGAGLRFKLLEAFSAGMATVTTTLGYEGIPCEPGTHLFVADTEKDFADAIGRLWEKPELRRRIGECAREFVKERYSLEATGAALESLYTKALE